MHRHLPVNSSCVAVVVLRQVQAGYYETLLLKRAKAPCKGHWFYVTGRIEGQETAVAAALRELQEETGLIPTRLYSGNATVQFYAPPVPASDGKVAGDCLMLMPAFVAYVAPEAQADESLCQVPDAESEAMEWVPLEVAIDTVRLPGQRRLLKEIQEEFTQRLPDRELLIFRSDEPTLG
ncbi:NUDIX domain-containing protein [Rhodovibrionaceae bacterium A322]